MMQTSYSDHSVSETLFQAGTRIPRPFWKVLEYSGDGLVWLAICFTALALPHTSPTARHLWANFLVGLVLDLIETGIIKGLVRRPRPQHNLIAKDMTVIVAVDHFSFPSGHSSRVSFIALFLACTVLQQEDNGLAMMVAAAWAVVVAFSRCMMGRHYLSDVLAGLLLGVATLAILTQGEFSKEGLMVPANMVNTLYAELILKRIG